jgi:lipopolysaccharide export system protein LptA
MINNVFPQIVRCLLLPLLAGAAVLPAWSQGKPAAASPQAEEPSTQILSNTLHYDEVKKLSTFKGNVVMTRGLLTMTAEKLELREDSQGFQHGTATTDPGKLVQIRQEKPENFEVLEGIGQRADYNGKDETFDLIGQAVVTRYICGKPFDTISGQQVRYNQKTDVYEAFSGPQSLNPGGRVRSIAQPRAKVDAAIAACRQSRQTLSPSESIQPPSANATSRELPGLRQAPPMLAPAVR